MICFTESEWEEYKKFSPKSLSEEELQMQACLDCQVGFQLESLDKGVCRPINFGLTPLWRNNALE